MTENKTVEPPAEPVIEAAAEASSPFADMMGSALLSLGTSSRRDEFAAAALQGMDLSDLVLKHQTDIAAVAKTIAAACFAISEAMVAESDRIAEAMVAESDRITEAEMLQQDAAFDAEDEGQD
jgi:hypothetical protein